MKPGEVKQLAQKFSVKVRRQRHIANGVYRLELTNGKCYALKPMAYPLAQIRWIDSVLEDLRAAGFTQISWRHRTEKEGRRLYVRHRSGKPYILNPWIEGRWPSPQSPEDMRTCGALLAEFHHNGRVSSVDSSRVYMIGKWPRELRLKHVTLLRQIALAGMGHGRKQAQSLLQDYGKELLRYSQEAQLHLRHSPYREACEHARQQQYICHGDGGPTNFIFTASGAYLIDFETLRVDMRAYDLYRIIYNSCKDQGWDFSIARSILDGYQTVSQLSQADLVFTIAWLRFPRTTTLLLNKYFRTQAPLVRARMVQGLPAAVAAERRVTVFLRALDQYKSGLNDS